MQIVINVPKSEIPKNQDIIEIPLHFIDGEVCEAGGYEFDVLPKGHGNLIDAGELLKQSYCIDDSATLSTRDVVNKEEIDNAQPIIKADKSSEVNNEMTIERACGILSNGLFNAPSEHEWCEAFEMAVDIMCKYQRIQQILKDIPYGGDATVRRIQGVIEDGKID